jgi:hypothetical protein
MEQDKLHDVEVNSIRLKYENTFAALAHLDDDDDDEEEEEEEEEVVGTCRA